MAYTTEQPRLQSLFDDLLVTSNSEKLVDEFFEQMKAFDVKDLGEAEKFLGIKIESETARGYCMSQRAMIDNLVDHCSLAHALILKIHSLLVCQ
jgi:hypothetical protein